MRITTPQITWHGGENGKNDPLLTADVHPCGVLATGGADAEVRFWLLRLNENEESKFQDFLYSFTEHERSINAVRFSPDGRSLATASDGGTIIIHLLPDGRPVSMWKKPKAARIIVHKTVRTTQSDIYDLAWSPSAKELVSVSVDSKVSFWDVSDISKKAPILTNFTSHSNYVQGVAWDPRDKFMVSQSNDRSCRIYMRKEAPTSKKDKKKESNGKSKAKSSTIIEYTSIRLANRAPPPVVPSCPQDQTIADGTDQGESENKNEEGKEADEVELVAARESQTVAAMPSKAPVVKRTPRANLFADETVPSFFRRPAWSPDGCLLVLPAGLYRPEGPVGSGGDVKSEFATHVYVRDRFERPALELPHPGSKASIVVRFCPQIFELKERASRGQEVCAGILKETKDACPPTLSLTNLPYRMVYAVLTINGILVYDTQHHYPLAFVKNSHYAPLTDAAWLADGSALIATSMDGYLTVLSFPDKELGEPLDVSKVPSVVRDLHIAHYDQMLREARAEEGNDERAADLAGDDAVQETSSPAPINIMQVRKKEKKTEVKEPLMSLTPPPSETEICGESKHGLFSKGEEGEGGASELNASFGHGEQDESKENKSADSDYKEGEEGKGKSKISRKANDAEDEDASCSSIASFAASLVQASNTTASGVKKTKRIRPTPVMSESAFAAAAAAAPIVADPSTIPSQTEPKENSAGAVACDQDGGIMGVATSKTVKKRVAPTCVSSTLG